ncbi:MAG: GIY-YIG nuclease family protein [Methanobacteriaceae archaeon]|nr:GIY-YIG nuclease family protein [Methanobacteriaceae archaeon]
MKGSYCLIIHMTKNNKLKIGSIYKEEYKFKKGWYVYIGSAMNSLIPRIKRHLSEDKKLHWHIDYLLNNQNTIIKEVLFTKEETKIECKLAQNISKQGEEIPKFGCSDCNCNSHLIYFKTKKEAVNSVQNAYNTLDIEYYNLNYFKKLIECEK